MKNPLETAEQATFVSWFRLEFKGVLIYAVPNGAHLSGDAQARARKMAIMKREGFVPGIPDLHVPAWRLRIEMKRRKGGRLSESQKEIIPLLELAGEKVMVCEGFSEARRMVLEWRKAAG